MIKRTKIWPVFVSATLFLWVWSIITSLWANIYERALQDWVSNSAPSTASEPVISLRKRTALLFLWSFLYVSIVAVMMQSFLRNAWGVLRQWARDFKMEDLRYNGAMSTWHWEWNDLHSWITDQFASPNMKRQRVSSVGTRMKRDSIGSSSSQFVRGNTDCDGRYNSQRIRTFQTWSGLVQSSRSVWESNERLFPSRNDDLPRRFPLHCGYTGFSERSSRQWFRQSLASFFGQIQYRTYSTDVSDQFDLNCDSPCGDFTRPGLQNFNSQTIGLEVVFMWMDDLNRTFLVELTFPDQFLRARVRCECLYM